MNTIHIVSDIDILNIVINVMLTFPYLYCKYFWLSRLSALPGPAIGVFLPEGAVFDPLDHLHHEPSRLCCESFPMNFNPRYFNLRLSLLHGHYNNDAGNKVILPSPQQSTFVRVLELSCGVTVFARDVSETVEATHDEVPLAPNLPVILWPHEVSPMTGTSDSTKQAYYN